MMPNFRLEDGRELHFRDDDCSDPWRKSEAVLLLHGNAESGAVWFGWMPYLTRQFRVIRPDMRGFGQSTPMPEDFPWNLDVIVDDFVDLMRSLGVEKFHLVGAKLGGTVARHFAARHPDMVLTLTLAGTPRPDRAEAAANVPGWVAEFEQPGGVKAWAGRTMRKRLGSAFPEEGIRWWTELMGRTPASTQLGFMQNIPMSDISADMPNITCPSLVITTEGSALGSVEATRKWQQTIARSRLLVLPGDSYHVAASDSDRCAMETLAFITEGHKAL